MSAPYTAQSFWNPLKDAFKESDGFTVHFHLRSGHTLKDVAVSGQWKPHHACIIGEMCTEDRKPVAINTHDVVAYEIEE